MAANGKKDKRRLSAQELRTFARILALAKPYALRLVIGAVCSLVGGGSIIAMFLSAQQLLGHLLDMREPADQAPSEAVATAIPMESAEADPEPPPGSVPQPRIPSDSAPAEIESAPSPAKPAPRSALLRRFITEDELERMERAGLPQMLAVCGLLLVMVLLNVTAAFISVYYLQWVGQRVVMDIRIRLFEHLQKLPVAFHHASRTGDMLSRTVADTQLLQNTVSNVMTDIVRQPIILLTVLGYILITEWRLALFALIILPVCLLPILLIGRRVRRISREGQRRMADLTSVMQEALAGIVVVKAFGQEKREGRRFSEQCRGFFRRMMSATKAKALNDFVNHFFGGIGGIAVLLYAAVARKPIEECVVFAFAIWALYEPIKRIGRINMEVQQSAAAADRIFEVLDTPVTVNDAPGARAIFEPLRELVFDKVDFSYGGNSPREVFKNLNLSIPAGRSLALVGPSGSGKTTLVSLLLRFFDVTGGRILFNDADIREFTLESLRGHIGLVMQDTFLFGDTVASNIAYGRPDATPDAIEDAARRANAHDFIKELPQGYDTILGERGVGLSGGQRQRLAIARAILRRPPILLLDEATSSLDTQSERMVQEDIDRLMGAHTVIVVAHRLSTIARCDKIAVLGERHIHEYGTHAELYALNGLYRELYDLQFATRSAPPADTNPRA